MFIINIYVFLIFMINIIPYNECLQNMISFLLLVTQSLLVPLVSVTINFLNQLRYSLRPSQRLEMRFCYSLQKNKKFMLHILYKRKEANGTEAIRMGAIRLKILFLKSIVYEKLKKFYNIIYVTHTISFSQLRMRYFSRIRVLISPISFVPMELLMSASNQNARLCIDPLEMR